MKNTTLSTLAILSKFFEKRKVEKYIESKQTDGTPTIVEPPLYFSKESTFMALLLLFIVTNVYYTL